MAKTNANFRANGDVGVSPVQGVLQRQCACGNHVSGGGECESCKKKHEGTLQRVAANASPTSDVPPIVHEVMRSPGQPLDAGTRAFMEPHFGHDFSSVRVHMGGRAEESARAVNALAYTVGSDVVLGATAGSLGPYASRGLMAHELSHVVQQTGNGAHVPEALRIGDPDDGLEREAEAIATGINNGHTNGLAGRHLTGVTGSDAYHLRRAVLDIGKQRVQIDYGNVARVPVDQYVATIESMFASWTGSPATTIHASIITLTPNQQQWVLWGIDLLMDNTTAAHAALDRTQAVQRLIAHAPTAANPIGGVSGPMQREVLRVSGWTEVALAAHLSAPTGKQLTDVRQEFNPPAGPGAPPSGALDLPRLQAEIPPALTTLLNRIDPANWVSTGTQSMSGLGSVADVIQTEAQALFAPYVDAARGNQLSAGWQYSANLSSTTSITPTPDQRIGYLLNRAEIVGRQATSGGSIFANVNFDSGRDQAELLAIVTTMEANMTTQAIVNRLIQQTGRTSRITGKVSVTPDYDSLRFTECQARWTSIDTLTHELIHVLAHPNFPAQASSVGFGQIIREGFTEVMGVQLHERVRSKAASDAAFKAHLEVGIAGPCPAPAAATIGYGDAGPAADRIRKTVGDRNFRAAYFLGAVNLVGL